MNTLTIVIEEKANTIIEIIHLYSKFCIDDMKRLRAVAYPYDEYDNSNNIDHNDPWTMDQYIAKKSGNFRPYSLDIFYDRSNDIHYWVVYDLWVWYQDFYMVLIMWYWYVMHTQSPV